MRRCRQEGDRAMSLDRSRRPFRAWMFFGAGYPGLRCAAPWAGFVPRLRRWTTRPVRQHGTLAGKLPPTDRLTDIVAPYRTDSSAVEWRLQPAAEFSTLTPLLRAISDHAGKNQRQLGRLLNVA